MLFIIGLGNPGPQYMLHRHNVGFMAVDAIREAHSSFSQFKRINAQTDVSEGKVEGIKTILIKPRTYMNLSGKAFIQFMQFYKPEREQILVIHDDIDLPFGRFKMKFGGGHGGHNGLRSMDSCVGKEYWRLRIGVGHPGVKEEVSNYVLSNFSSDEQDKIDDSLRHIAENFTSLIKEQQFSDDNFAKVKPAE